MGFITRRVKPMILEIRMIQTSMVPSPRHSTYSLGAKVEG